MSRTHTPIPKDYPVRPLRAGQAAKDRATCGHCGLSWDDAIVTGSTPAPAARCPFEYFHVYPSDVEPSTRRRALSVELPMVDWQAAYDRASADARRQLDDQAAAAATRYARLSAYISARLAGGNHQSGVRRQNIAARKVRQALGFTYKDDAINF